jgi:glycosyl hydrolase family 20
MMTFDAALRVAAFVGVAGVALWPAFWVMGCTSRPEGEPEMRQTTRGAGLPIRGLHLSAFGKADLPVALAFVREVLPREGINTLIIEFNYRFDYRSRPGFANDWALDVDDARKLAEACQQNGIRLIPQINCLGHQSWSRHTGTLLTKHPEFDETPGKYPNNEGIYCRSYCPLHPQVHAVLFDLIDELAQACQAEEFHVGMDEVFILADPDCPRCKGKAPADLFAGEVKTLHDHLASIGCRMWMWGDRFLDDAVTGTGKWEGSTNGTAPAIDQVPKDIVICDWHYVKAFETPRIFAGKGFDVVACPWQKSDVALEQLAQIRALRGATDADGGHGLGMLQTTWCPFGLFAKAYRAQVAGDSATEDHAGQAAACFRAICKAMRAEQ